MPTPRVHLVIPTHTTRHLAACVASVAWQTRPPDTVIATTDGDGAELAAGVASAWVVVPQALGARTPAFEHVRQAHGGVARLNRVRNNALRALAERHQPRDGDAVVVLDGDTVLAPDAIERHAAAITGGEMVIPWRVYLDESTTPRVHAEALVSGTARAEIDRALSCAMPELRVRERRFARHVWMRRWVPWALDAHKPKIIGGHHAVSWGALRAVNGYDERFEGYGYDDDDLARRLHRLGARVVLAITSIHAFHLWHPTRAAGRPTQTPGYATFCEPWTARCGRGIVG